MSCGTSKDRNYLVLLGAFVDRSCQRPRLGAAADAGSTGLGMSVLHSETSTMMGVSSLENLRGGESSPSKVTISLLLNKLINERGFDEEWFAFPQQGHEYGFSELGRSRSCAKRLRTCRHIAQYDGCSSEAAIDLYDGGATVTFHCGSLSVSSVPLLRLLLGLKAPTVAQRHTSEKSFQGFGKKATRLMQKMRRTFHEATFKKVASCAASHLPSQRFNARRFLKANNMQDAREGGIMVGPCWAQAEPPRLLDRTVALELCDDLPSEAVLAPEAGTQSQTKKKADQETLCSVLGFLGFFGDLWATFWRQVDFRAIKSALQQDKAPSVSLQSTPCAALSVPCHVHLVPAPTQRNNHFDGWVGPPSTLDLISKLERLKSTVVLAYLLAGSSGL